MTSFSIKSIPKIPLCLLPTPIAPMKRLTEYLGKDVNIFVKRDDLTGIAFGGNKNRKLEYLLADARGKGVDVIVTEGAVQSNHCLQTAAAAAKLGFACELVLSGDEPETITGNYLLDQILDARIHLVKDSSMRKTRLKTLENELKKSGKHPYIIPTGGSTKVGALGYVSCMNEIATQSIELGTSFDYLVHSSGSGGTQSGILLGKMLYYPDIEVFGISPGDAKSELEAVIRKIIKEFIEEWGLELSIDRSAIKVLDGYYGSGYGIPNQEMVSAVKTVAKLEGIFLDPVYNGKAMVGLIDLIKTGVIPSGKNVLFLHSGGIPAIFSFVEAFRNE